MGYTKSAPVVSAIMTASSQFPHLRVGQLIDNAGDHFKEKHPELYNGDLFYIPDDILILALNRYVEDFGGKNE